MRKAKQDVDQEFDELQYFGGEPNDGLDLADDSSGRDGTHRLKPARQRVELRNEQKSLREQLSDWDDYSDDYDTEL
ncbi:MAG TPA: hypothetical protein VFY39_08155 [Gammaproteobacteria bacterium]|nr:hypothetical protein [Gammaproteobacteria bacterium]